jgi:hypothetical protein
VTGRHAVGAEVIGKLAPACRPQHLVVHAMLRMLFFAVPLGVAALGAPGPACAQPGGCYIDAYGNCIFAPPNGQFVPFTSLTEYVSPLAQGGGLGMPAQDVMALLAVRTELERPARLSVTGIANLLIIGKRSARRWPPKYPLLQDPARSVVAGVRRIEMVPPSLTRQTRATRFWLA